MASRKPTDTKASINENTVLFTDAEEAWFWFMSAQAARNDGARFVAGQSLYPRPCEPIDILKVLDRLHRQRRLERDHLMVLRHYGHRSLPPDPTRSKEIRAYHLWNEALDRIGAVLEKKGIIASQRQPHENWHEEAFIFQAHAMEAGMAAE